MTRGQSDLICFTLLFLQEIPSKIVNSSRTAGGRPWINTTLRDLIRRKSLAWRKFKQDQSSVNLSDFRCVRNKVTSGLRRAEQQYILSLQRNSCNGESSKPFWCYVKHLVGSKNVSHVPDLEKTFPTLLADAYKTTRKRLILSTDSL